MSPLLSNGFLPTIDPSKRPNSRTWEGKDGVSMTNVLSLHYLVTCDTARWRLLGLDLSALGADIVS